MAESVLEYLQARGVSFEIKLHANPALTCEAAAAERHVRLSQIVKCMVGITDDARLVAMLIPGDRKLKSSKVRKWLHAKRLDLVSPNDLESRYGLVVGAISPVQLVGNSADVLMDPSVLEEELVDISGGDPLLGIEMSSSDLRTVVNAQLVDMI